MARFGRVISAMITPFGNEGQLDLEGAVGLATWLQEQGHEGLVLAGTTGESATLSHDEQIALVEAVADAVNIPVIAGAGSNNTAEAIDLAERAASAGADGLLVVTPYYNRPSQGGLQGYFRSVAAATDLPVMLYDIPGRTGRKIETDTLLSLAHEVDNIVALKDAAGDPAETASFIARAPEGFEVYSGDSSLTLPLVSVGAVGVVGVCSHWTTAEHVAMFDAIGAGNLAEATRINQQLIPSFDFENVPEAPNPVPTKAILRELGLPAGFGRSPMDFVPDGLAAAARAVLATTAVGSA